ncbi:MAG TPA: hypothetical protein VMV92_45810 [Streptosporangiaceae bacterium]|nr:hypothetical protein [Streptosporangiaceae bacterium]
MDRWLEIDLDWFGPPPCHDRITEFAERVAPLWAGATGWRGVVLNIGWLADIVTEWTGDPAQHLPLRSRRYQRLRQSTYDQLRAFIADLKEAAGRHGAPDLKVGLLIAGLGYVVAPRDTGAMYDLYSNWYDRHPELYPLDISDLPGPDLDPRVLLRADDYPYASRPGGVTEGESYGDLLGDQWGSLSRFLGLDVIHLRDGFWGPLLYSRRGPYGEKASADPRENQSWTDALIRLIRSVKEANPDALVMAYSSGISNTGEWRSGCIDIQQIVADGALDIWIDQTWGGAWQDWWDDWWKGWTYQYANLLGHGVPLREGNQRRAGQPCRHYKLIETWDGWEPWDTIHRTPGKLLWGIWSFSHACVLTADGPRVPEGSYISWMNDWDLLLLSASDVTFIAGALDQAEASARELTEPFGPVAVFDYESVAAVHAKSPRENVSEWTEDHLAMLLKWGTPVLAASSWRDAPERAPEGYIAQVPAAIPDAVKAMAGQPGQGALVAAGRADHLDPWVLERAGLRLSGVRHAAGYRRDTPTSPDLPQGDSVHLPDHEGLTAAPDTVVRYAAKGVPLISGRSGCWLWQPPDLAAPGNPLMPRSQLGTIAPYVEMSRVLAEESAGIRTEQVPVELPVTIQSWRSGGTVYVLAGNLESGWVGDSRSVRVATVVIPRARAGLGSGQVSVAIAAASGEDASISCDEEAGLIRLTIQVPASGCVLARVGSEAAT